MIAMTTRTTAAGLLGLLLAACSGDLAAERERVDALEDKLRNLSQEVTSLRQSAQAKAAGVIEFPYYLKCQPPLQGYIAVSDAQATCRAVRPSPEGLYPQCNVFFQKEASIETKDYFEYTVNGTPQLYSVTNYKDEQTKINDVPAFQATFEAQRAPLPMKMLGALIPHDDGLYTITCFATVATFGDYEEAFRRTISSFEFRKKP
jgi:hypothetical protein